MLRLKDHLANYEKVGRAFWRRVLAEKGPTLFKDTLFLSFLGARICYASSPPLALFAEERFRDPEKLLAFLRRLKNSGHTSIFAHSPLVVDASGVEQDALARAFFKAWWSLEGACLCLNLRHAAEILDDGEFATVLEASLTASKAWQEFPVLIFGFDAQGDPVLEARKRLGEIVADPPKEPSEVFASMRVAVIDVAREETAPFGWLAVVVEGFSRLFSHQFVRHTWLNFNQRSHRYTSVDQFVYPPSFDVYAEARTLYQGAIDHGLDLYQRLVKAGVKKEDARFVTPQGAATSLLATGPYFVWEDFVRKRRHKKAQWEIRRLARAVEQALDILGA